MASKLKQDFLLAKSFKENQWKGSCSLVGHTSDVVNAITTLVDTLGERLIDQFNLQCDLSYLRETARLAAYLHDWGKANEHFQQVVRHQRNSAEKPQLLRHEVVSVMLAWEFKEWLEQAKGDFFTALVAAGGHHLKLGGRAGKQNDELGEIRYGTGDDSLTLYVLDSSKQYHPNFRQLLKYGIKSLDLPKVIKLARCPSRQWTIKQIKQKRLDIVDFLTNEWNHDPVFLSLIKGLLIAGDAAGSAISTTGLFIKKWISEELNNILDEEKLQKVINARLDGQSLRPFQIQLAQSTSRVTLARAGCGTGKTLGAYNWAKSKALGRKLIFCYPTTGTSTEGFLDYVHGEIDSVLLHSRAEVDLEMASTGEEEEAGEGTDNEAAIKLDSFKAWGKEAIVCTVDTVLGLLQCNRKPIYCFPVIAQAAFVFDEVHCYDEHLFGSLLRFLEVVKAPMLLMSASFLPWQLEEIQKAVGEPLEIIAGPKDLEEQPRYRFYYQDAPNWQRVEQELNNDGKVLWVCNQVKTSIAVYNEAIARGINAVLYHSRFRYQDRVRHHREVVDAFKSNQNQPVLAIATQVAEMSLDLSATLLISQIADPAGLIQRLGRLNRRYCGFSLDAHFYLDDKAGFPYSQEQLNDGLSLIKSFQGDISQGVLANWLENSEHKGNPQKQSVLLDGSWRTYATSLRKSGFNITVVLEQDINEIKSKPSKELQRFTLPITANPKKIKHWKRLKFYPVAPGEEWEYSPEIGAFESKYKK